MAKRNRQISTVSTENSIGKMIVKDLKRNKYKYLIVLPVLIYLIVFAYKPMYGIVIAFQNYRPFLGISGSHWVGFDNFKTFFNDVYFIRLLRNTFSISLLSILLGFPAPIMLALLLNEIKSSKFKKVVQTISYMPYFISIVVVCGLLKAFSQTDGVFNDIIVAFGGQRSNLLSVKENFYPIYIISGIWQNIGWDSIIYLAALAGIDQEQYEAARVDGAGRLKQMLFITLPGLMPTITVLFILRMGGVLNVGYEKILLLYQPLTYEVADVISTYVYRKGIVEANYSFSTAIGLFNSFVNICFLMLTNWFSKKVNKTGLF
ncbi:MAG: sugar transporter permease [Clostridia bacterium]|jgi:putative aldouronate transport system permease protein|nr:sugar transporter permease [Herbinix sp.]MDF2893127.1 sugar transporter permease [Clostridia bacterium]